LSHVFDLQVNKRGFRQMEEKIKELSEKIIRLLEEKKTKWKRK